MGRKKAITEEQLISLINEFYYKVCEGNANRLKVPEIGKYMRENGYSELKDYTIRRNATAMAHITKLKETNKEKDVALVVTYKTMDVEKFINTNRGDTRMKKALTELDMYYKNICEAATLINETHKKNEQKIKELEKKLEVALLELDSRKSNESKLKKENAALMAERKSLKEIVDTYVYPEIANELLAKSGLLQNTSGIVDEKAIEIDIVKADTKVKSESNVIKGMFNRFGE